MSGEEIRFGIERDQIAEFLTSRGFHSVKNATASDLQSLYFIGANANRTVASVYAIVTAKVGPEATTRQ